MAFTRFAFKLDDGTNVIDIAKAMSMHFRTLVRQKQVFTILGGQIVDNVDPTSSETMAAVKVSTAPNTWYVKAAINRCFKAWKAQRARTLSNTENDNGDVAVGKYADFKLSLNGQSTDDNILPLYLENDNQAGVLQEQSNANEWQVASVVNEGEQERHFKIIGDHDDFYYSATKGWLQTVPLPDAEEEPDMIDMNGDNTPDYRADFLNLLNETHDGQPERLTLLYEDNDDAPFATRQVFGDVNQDGNLQLQSLTYLSSVNPHHAIPGFKALCGLIQVDVEYPATSPILFLDVANTPEAF